MTLPKKTCNPTKKYLQTATMTQLATPDQQTEGKWARLHTRSSRSCSSLNKYIPKNPPAPLSPVQKTDGGGCATVGQNEYHTPAKAGSELTCEMENQAQTTW
ncbi:hypothetical protein BS47DRAFT_1364288 [Hydnum rufescens UP504]|uniref:Uncharacterized protein n=1 Tax=Hydnum rufescens UP504 TaxID=1448309 RepID=A0A9P6DQ93_9AGAM|nr:hypothetical protein BS47DRAFT_1364288 [Hydnum rufescens UP504]